MKVKTNIFCFYLKNTFSGPNASGVVLYLIRHLFKTMFYQGIEGILWKKTLRVSFAGTPVREELEPFIDC